MTPDPTAVAAATQDIAKRLGWAPSDIQEIVRESFAAADRHLAARASAEDRALVENYKQSLYRRASTGREVGLEEKRDREVEAAYNARLARLAQRPAIDRAAWERFLERTRSVLTRGMAFTSSSSDDDRDYLWAQNEEAIAEVTKLVQPHLALEGQ